MSDLNDTREVEHLPQGRGAESEVSRHDIVHGLQDCMNIFLALADPVRQDIIRMLMETKRMNVSQIAEQSPMSRPTVSHHLKILKTAGIVSAKKEATEVYYRLETGGSLAKLKSLVEMIEAFDSQKHSSQ